MGGERHTTVHVGGTVLGVVGLALWWPLLRRVSWFHVLYGVADIPGVVFATYGVFTVVALAVVAVAVCGRGRVCACLGGPGRAGGGALFASLLAVQLAVKAIQILLVPAGMAGLMLALLNAALFALAYVGLACVWARWVLLLPGTMRASVLAGSFGLSFLTRSFGYLAFPVGELLTAAMPALGTLCAHGALRRMSGGRPPCVSQTAEPVARRERFHRSFDGMPGLLAVFLVIAALARTLAFGPLDGEMLSAALSLQDIVTIALAVLVLACCRFGTGSGPLLRFLWPAATVILFAGLFLMGNADEGLIGAGKQIMIVGRTMLGLLFWLLLADVADGECGDPVICLALPFVAVDALSSLLGYVALPGVFCLVGFTASELGATLAMAVTFALVAVSVLMFSRAVGDGAYRAGEMPAVGSRAGSLEVECPVAPEHRQSQAPAFAPVFGLTQREEQVATLLAQGNSQRRIAELMGVSIGTVQTHVKAVYRKLGIHSKQELIDRVHEL